eukprot:GHVU01042711.1.p1 GENE.GHVU01042711.1~~GHVU01042711.1.p1  ORF type:complete len:141 (-),score=15.95 GHVU01042711.1:187-609(-)
MPKRKREGEEKSAIECLSPDVLGAVSGNLSYRELTRLGTAGRLLNEFFRRYRVQCRELDVSANTIPPEDSLNGWMREAKFQSIKLTTKTDASTGVISAILSLCAGSVRFIEVWIFGSSNFPDTIAETGFPSLEKLKFHGG